MAIAKKHEGSYVQLFFRFVVLFLLVLLPTLGFNKESNQLFGK